MENIGNIFKVEREKKGLLLRQVASAIDIDQAVLSKIERGDRSATKQQLMDLIKYFKLDEKEILVEWYSQKISSDLQKEDLAIDILNKSIKKIKANK